VQEMHEPRGLLRIRKCKLERDLRVMLLMVKELLKTVISFSRMGDGMGYQYLA
jgi:hypothetical protein